MTDKPPTDSQDFGDYTIEFTVKSLTELFKSVLATHDIDLHKRLNKLVEKKVNKEVKSAIEDVLDQIKSYSVDDNFEEIKKRIREKYLR